MNQLCIFLCFVLSVLSPGECFWFRRSSHPSSGMRDAVNSANSQYQQPAAAPQMQPQLMYDSATGQINMAVPVPMSMQGMPSQAYSVMAPAPQQPLQSGSQAQGSQNNPRDVQMVPIQFVPCVCMPAPSQAKDQTPQSSSPTFSTGTASPINVSNPPTEAYRSLQYLHKK